MRWLSVILLLLAFVVTQSCNSSQTKHGARPGKETYSTYCISCHGEQGQKQLYGAAMLTHSTMNDEAMKKLIKKGKRQMPAYGGILDEDKVGALIDYVKQFRNRAAHGSDD